MAGTLRRQARIAVLTPPQRGAIAVLRVWGPDALAIADTVFLPARGAGLASTPPNRLRLGRIGSGLGDEVVAVVLASGVRKEGGTLESPSVEIQCHGGLAACELVIQAFVDQGTAQVTRSEWVSNDNRSPIKAAAHADICLATTVRTAEILLDQTQGALDREIDAALTLLKDGTLSNTIAAIQHLDRLIAWGDVGVRLLHGWRVVLTGRPNVGKSSLLNALAGFRRSIVHETPGTTRDVVTVAMAVDGWPIEVSDTAGIRETSRELESTGIEKARQAIAQAELIVPVLEGSQPLLREDEKLLRSLRGHRVPIVVNKSDLPSAWEPSAQGIDPSHVIAVSAQAGTGISQLVTAIGRYLVPEPPPAGAGVPFRAEQVEAIREAKSLAARRDHAVAATRLARLLRR